MVIATGANRKSFLCQCPVNLTLHVDVDQNIETCCLLLHTGVYYCCLYININFLPVYEHAVKMRSNLNGKKLRWQFVKLYQFFEHPVYTYINIHIYI